MSFRLKTIFGVAAIEAVLLFIIIVNAMALLRETNAEELFKRAAQTAENLALTATDAVLSTDLATLQSFVDELSSYPDIIFVRFVDGAGTVLAQAGAPEALDAVFSPDHSLEDVNNEVLHAAAPIAVDSMEFGQVQLGLSAASIQRVQKKARQRFYLLAGAAIGLSALFSLGLGVLLTRRLHDLAHGSQRVAEGDMGYQIPVRGNDELARTAKAFNAMSRELEQTYAALNATLEDQTRALKESEQARAKLLESENRLQAILNSAADGILTIDFQGRILSFNPAAERIFGYTAGETLGQDVSMLMPARYRDQHHAAMEKRLTDPQAPSTILDKVRGAEGLRKDGSEFPLELAVTMLPVADKLLYTGVVRDVTDRQAAENEIRSVNRQLREMSQELELRVAMRTAELTESEEMLRTILEGIKAGILLVDKEHGTIISANDRAAELAGRSPGELEDQPLDQALPITLDDPAAAVADSDNKNLDQTGTLTLPDGAKLPVSRNLLPLRYDGKDMIVCILFDITRRRNLERQLNISQKLESIGQLAAGIAHEINTPVQYIGDNMSFIKDAFADLTRLYQEQAALLELAKTHEDMAAAVTAVEKALDQADLEFLNEEIPRAIEQSLEGVQRVTTIVQAMKRFSRIEEKEDMKPVDLNKAVESTITVARNEWKYVAELVTDLAGDLPPVTCRPGDINQVLLNIVVNGAHAIAEKLGTHPAAKGRITISTRAQDDFAVIAISDSGVGIPEEVRNRIFDPFYTTKEVGKGTGQGLAIVHDIIINKHQGAIDVESQPGEGSTFIIKLPVHGPQKPAPLTKDALA